MRTFAPKPKSAGQNDLAKLGRPRRTSFGPTREEESGVHSHRADFESPEGRNGAAFLNSALHDFSQIQVHAAPASPWGSPIHSWQNPSTLPTLQRKRDCACGGECPECKAKAARQRLNFSGELTDNVFQFGPGDANAPAPIAADTGSDAGIAKPAKAAGDCTDLCDRAYADSALNTGGGGVVCEKGVKCACVFDVPPLKRGQCPDFDEVVRNHERRHLPEADCAADAPLSRLGPKPGVDLTAAECTHRKESCAEIDALLPTAKGDCKTGMTSIRAGLASWITANCGAKP